MKRWGDIFEVKKQTKKQLSQLVYTLVAIQGGTFLGLQNQLLVEFNLGKSSEGICLRPWRSGECIHSPEQLPVFSGS